MEWRRENAEYQNSSSGRDGSRAIYSFVELMYTGNTPYVLVKCTCQIGVVGGIGALFEAGLLTSRSQMGALHQRGPFADARETKRVMQVVYYLNWA